MKQDITLLDQYNAGKISTSHIQQIFPVNNPMIYAFITDDVKDAIKVGYTDQGVQKRIDQWKKIYNNVILIGYWSADTFLSDGTHVMFKDYPVHNLLEEHGYRRLLPSDFIGDIHVSKEFFEKLNSNGEKDLSNDIIEDIINKIKQAIYTGTASFKYYNYNKDVQINHTFNDPATFRPTPLQQTVIDKASKYIKTYNGTHIDLLMAAVMRFGKTFTTYQIIKTNNIKYVLICSAKADVRSAWRRDINHVDFIDDFCFIEFENGNTLITEKGGDNKLHTKSCSNNIIDIKRQEGKTVIVFTTLQDLSGLKKEDNRYIKDRHDYIFNNQVDMIVIDESHYGTHSKTYGKATGLSYMNRNEEENDVTIVNNIVKQLSFKYRLQCSGTPYYILRSYEFNEIYDNRHIIADVSYSDMVQLRDEWFIKHYNEEPSNNPYFGIPDIHIIGMNLTNECRNKIKDQNLSIRFNELFKVTSDGQFKNKKEIKNLFEILYKRDNRNIGFLDTDHIRNGAIFKHTIIVVPSRESAHLLKNLLETNNILGDNRKCIVAVDQNDNIHNMDKCAETEETLNNELNNLEKEGKRSVIITVQRLLTGVSLPLVDSMLMMNDCKSVQDYDQAIFRVCTRNVVTATNDTESFKITCKPNVYVIDFNIDRVFEMRFKSAESITTTKNKKQTTEQIINELNKTMPVTVECAFSDNNTTKILDAFHRVENKEMLDKYIEYSKLSNAVKSIQDQSQLTRIFNSFLSTAVCKNILSCISNTYINNKNKTDGNDSVSLDSSTDECNNECFKNNNTTKQSNKIDKDTKNRLQNLLTYIILSNLLQENISKDINEYQDNISDDVLSAFNISKEYVINFINELSIVEQEYINRLFMSAYRTVEKDGADGFIDCITVLNKLNKNEVFTSNKLIEKMVNKLHLSNNSTILLVADKCDFLSYFIKNYKKLNINIKNIRVIPSSIISKYIIIKYLKLNRQHDSIDNIIINTGNDNVSVLDTVKYMKNKGKRFDVCIMNAPYQNGLHEKFETAAIDMVNDEIVFVGPLSWVIDKNKKIDMCKYVNMYYTEISTISNNWEYFDADIQIILGITYICKNKKDNTIIYNDTYFNKAEDIYYIYRKDLIPFRDIIYNLSVNTNNNVHNHVYKISKDLNKFKSRPVLQNPTYIYKIPGCRSVHGSASRETGYTTGEMFTLVGKKATKDTNCGLYSELKNDEDIKYFIPFDTYEESINFDDYIHTPFAIACLSLIRHNANIDNGELMYLPWLDFTKKWTNDKLLKHFNVPDNIINIINELPNFYNNVYSNEKSTRKTYKMDDKRN